MYSNRQLTRLLFPLLVEQTLGILVGIVDTAMVSGLGDAAISGVSLVDMICNVIISMFAALATGGAVVSAQLLGAKRREDACRSANQLALAVLGISVGIMVPMILFRRPIFGALFGSVQADVWENAMTYLWITALSYPFIALYNGGAALCRSMNRSGITMVVSIMVNVINIGGNALCLYGLGMGVEGVAIPTLISRASGAAAMFILLRSENLQIHLMRGQWRPDWKMMKEIMHIGIPNGMENSLFQLGRVLVVRVITLFGTVQIAANAVANTLDSVGCMPGQTVNLAMITVVGQCIGAGDFKQARHYTKKLLLWAYAGMAVLNIPMLILLPQILTMFDVSPEAAQLARVLILIHNGMAMLLWPLAFTLPNSLRAARDVKYTMVVALSSMALFRILFSYILGKGLGWGAVGVWVAMIIDWVCRIAFYVGRYCSHKWEENARVTI